VSEAAGSDPAAPTLYVVTCYSWIHVSGAATDEY